MPDTPTPREIANELERLDKAASAPSWEAGSHGDVYRSEKSSVEIVGFERAFLRLEDAEFTCYARNHTDKIVAWLQELERLRRLKQRVEKVVPELLKEADPAPPEATQGKGEEANHE